MRARFLGLFRRHVIHETIMLAAAKTALTDATMISMAG